MHILKKHQHIAYALSLVMLMAGCSITSTDNSGVEFNINSDTLVNRIKAITLAEKVRFSSSQTTGLGKKENASELNTEVVNWNPLMKRQKKLQDLAKEIALISRSGLKDSSAYSKYNVKFMGEYTVGSFTKRQSTSLSFTIAELNDSIK